MKTEQQIIDAHWWRETRHEYCHQLTNRELTDGPLARLAVRVGYPSLTSVLNDWNGWGMTVGYVEVMLASTSEGRRLVSEQGIDCKT